MATLETLYPNRVELGLGRAPGTDMQTAAALRRGRNSLDFPAEIAELRGYFKDSNPVSAYPSAGLNIPFYILGSSTESAYLVAELGLPYAFASHFAPRMMEMAVEIYRKNFKPSTYLAEPYVILGVNAIVAETDKEARQLATTQTLFFLNVVTNAQQNFTTTDGIRRRCLESPNACSKETALWTSRFRGNPDLQPRTRSGGTNDCLFADRLS